MKTVLLVLTFCLFAFSGMGMANNITVGVLDEARCIELATAYANDLSSLSKDEIAELRFCLALT